MEDVNTNKSERQGLKSSDHQNKRDLTCFFDDVARKYGHDEAIVAGRIYFWMNKNTQSKRNLKDGRTWTYDSAKNLAQRFSWWSESQIRRIISRCVSKGLILVSNYNQKPGDNTNWYTLTDAAIKDFQSIAQQSILENPQQFLSQNQEIESLKQRILELECQLPPPNDSVRGSDDFVRGPNDFVRALPDIQPEILTQEKEYSIKVCLIGNSESEKKQTNSKNINDLGHLPIDHLPVDNLSTTNENKNLTKRYPNQSPIEHMLNNSYGCSKERIRAYAESRKKCGAVLTQSAWDGGVRVLLEMAKERTLLSPDQVIDILIERKDGNTRFKDVLSFAEFEKKFLTTYDMTRGQDEESVIFAAKRMAMDHTMPSDYDFDKIALIVTSGEVVTQQEPSVATTTTTETETQRKFECIEPEWRMIAKREFEERTSPQTHQEKTLTKEALLYSVFNTMHSRAIESPVIDYKYETGDCTADVPKIDSRTNSEPSGAILLSSSNLPSQNSINSTKRSAIVMTTDSLSALVENHLSMRMAQGL